MRRVSSQAATEATADSTGRITVKSRRRYVASKDYGTRGAEREKRILTFGKYRATIYRRADLDRSSWFLRVFLKEEGRHYRKSLQTTDYDEAVTRATSELVGVLSKVESGQRILAVSLKDLVRRFSIHLEQQVASGALSPRTLVSQRYRVMLGVEFLKTQLSAGLDAKISGINGEVFHKYLDWRLAKAATDRKDGKIRRDVVRDELLVIRKMFLFARKEKLCAEGAVPTWDFVVERQGPRGERITQQDYKRFINAVRTWIGEAKNEKDHYHRRLLHHFVLVVANSGMRSGELFGLRNQDVEIRASAKECIVTIRAETSKVRRERRITLIASTGGRSDGSWEVNYLQRWLADLRASQRTQGLRVLALRYGQEDRPRCVLPLVKLLRIKLKDIGLDWFDTYHCRHFWITNRLLAEEPIHFVAKAAGTSTSEMKRPTATSSRNSQPGILAGSRWRMRRTDRGASSLSRCG